MVLGADSAVLEVRADLVGHGVVLVPLRLHPILQHGLGLVRPKFGLTLS